MPTAPPLHDHDEFSLAALLALFEDDLEPPRPVPHEPAAGLALASTTAGRAGRVVHRVRAWSAAWCRRAAEWGMGPEGSRRAW